MLSSQSYATNGHPLSGSPFAAYVYSYPHKTAYRNVDARSLSSVWKSENQAPLFLYVHIPFCEFRCGFCNLFTLSQPEAGLSSHYMSALAVESEIIREAIPSARFGQVAIGGGTPTFLSTSELELLFDTIYSTMDVAKGTPIGCEASPATLSEQKLRLLYDAGVTRLSLGVQSFDDAECGGIGRPQSREIVENSLELIRKEI